MKRTNAREAFRIWPLRATMRAARGQGGMKKHLGHYEIVAEIGRGGMGVVYKGYEPSLARYVAIKELSPALAHDPVVVERFLREARSMALLNDPHIIQIYSIGQENDEPFFVMEFVDGESVAGLIKRDGRLESDDALKIVHQTAQGLSTAHDRGVIHRDIKPANLMITQRGLVKIADFGIALANHDMSAKLTSAGDLVGTAAYLSPEVMQGGSVDTRSEVYAVGIVLYEMLCGRTPFSNSNVYKLMHDVVQTDTPDVREFNPDIEPGVAAILARMLMKDAAARYQTMHELIADLEELPLITRGGPIKVKIDEPGGVTGTIVGLSTPMTPGFSPRIPAPPPEMGRHQSAITPLMTSVLTPRGLAAKAASPTKPAISEPTPDSPVAPTTATRSQWPLVLIMAVLMFLAGATLALRGQLFGNGSPSAPATATTQPSADKGAPSSGPLTVVPTATPTHAPAQKNLFAAYSEAGIVALIGLLMTGFWFGVHRRHKDECEAGILSLANMKWRDCIGLLLEAMGRDGYKGESSSKPTGDGGTEFVLLRGNERVLVGFKLGSTYQISDANVREFANGLQMQGTKTGILLTLGSAEGSARDIAKRYGIELIDGATIWPKVRQLLPPNVMDHVRLQVAAQSRKGLWIGSIGSILIGAMTFLVAAESSPEGNAGISTVMAAPVARTVKAAAPAPTDAAVLKRITAANATMDDVDKMSEQQRNQRRVDAAKQVSVIPQVAHAAWPTQSTLQVSLRQTDGTDANLIDEICRTLAQYEEMRFTRLQIDPPDHQDVRWRQCK
jgi:serine/threonine protein kinase